MHDTDMRCLRIFFLLYASQLHRVTGVHTHYDVVIVGCGVGGHGAALHAVSKGLKVAVLTGGDPGGTCVNRGCVPSKALLAASGKVRELSDTSHLAALGIDVDGPVKFDRTRIAAHATNLASNIRGNLLASLKRLGVVIYESRGFLQSPTSVLAGNVTLTAAAIILSPGSTPFVPPGIQVDNKTIFTSDQAVLLDWIPKWLVVVGSGYIGLEFSDIYTALGSQVTFVEAGPRLMPGIDEDIANVADKLLIQPRGIDVRLSARLTAATPGDRGRLPTRVVLEGDCIIEPDAVLVATGRRPNSQNLGLEALGVQLDERGYIPTNDRMRMLKADGSAIASIYAIGDVNGRMMLAHAASAQGISAVENIVGNWDIVRHEAIPAACFTHPEIALVGLSESDAAARAEDDGFELGRVTAVFRANSKALAARESEGLAKLLFDKTSGRVLGVHVIGMHAADLIQQAANAVSLNATVAQLSRMVHTHPTLSEVIESLWRQAVGMIAR